MTLVDRARALRPYIEKASASLTDQDALAAVELFPAWSGAGVVYKTDDRVRHKDILYRCLQGHTSQEDWAPGEAVSLWVQVDDPAVEWPEWRKPAGAHDAYAKGAKVSHNGDHWTSSVDANVWEPGEYGWDKA